LPDDSNWRLRRHLQARHGPIVIGAATQPLQKSADRDAAFYEFVQPIYLEPLDERESEACMRALAQRRGDGGKPVIEVLDKQPERLKTLHTLTGGNPRVLTLIYRLLEAGQSDAAMADLEILLDQVTPYYKARVEEYQTPQQRAVIDAIALNWDPITTGDLARVTKVVTTTLSPLLIRLRKDGLIENVETSGSYAGHQFVERFFNIWYLMRHGTRRAKQKMRWLVAFLTSFYSPRELAEIERRASDMGLRKGWSADFALAFEQALVRESRSYINNEQVTVPTSGVAVENRLECKIFENGEKVNDDWSISDADLWRQASEFSEAKDYRHGLLILHKLIVRFENAQEPILLRQFAMALVNKAIMLGGMGDDAAAVAAYDFVLARFADVKEPTVQGQIARALVNKAVTLGRMGDNNAAIAVSDEVLARFGDASVPALREQVAMALINRAIALGQMGRNGAAVAVYDDVLARFAGDRETALREKVATALVYKTSMLGHMGEGAAAVAACEDILTRFADAPEIALRQQVAMALINKAIILGSTGDNAAEVAVYDDILARFSSSSETALHHQVARALINKAITLGQMGNQAAEVAVYDEMLARFADTPDTALREQVATAFVNKAITRGQMGDKVAEIALYDEVVARFAGAIEAGLREQVARALFYKARALLERGDSAAAISTLERFLNLADDKASPPHELLFAVARISLANLLLDAREDFERAETLYRDAAYVEPLSARANLAWLYLLADQLPDAVSVRKSLVNLPERGRALLDAAIEIANDNFGLATQHLTAATGTKLDSGNMDFSGDVVRLLRLAEKRGYGEPLLAWFEQTGIADRIAPIYAAFKAYVRNESVLLDVNPEVRRPAKAIYDQLDAPRRHRSGASLTKEQSTRRRKARRKTP
jgi:tetratricopeptide (TPR) repeat protein